MADLEHTEYKLLEYIDETPHITYERLGERLSSQYNKSLEHLILNQYVMVDAKRSAKTGSLERKLHLTDSGQQALSAYRPPDRKERLDMNGNRILALAALAISIAALIVAIVR